MKRYPNIEAVLIGTVSGSYSEWPQLRVELTELTATIAQQQADIKVLSEIVLEAHIEIKQWAYQDGSEPQQRPCFCPACVIARKVMEGS